MQKFRKSVFAIPSSTVGVLLLAGSVQATELTTAWAVPEASTGVRQAVSYADLNLSTPEGMAAMQERIAAAAAEVCGPIDYRDAGGLRRAHRNLQCRKDAIAAATSQLPDSQVASTD